MPNEEPIENLLDRAIDKVLSKKENSDEDIKKRKPKPFRYITEEEFQLDLTNQKTQTTLMREEPAPNIVEDKFCILGLGDLDTIENVLKKHEATRKFKDK